jgi:hypothetical protein
VADSFSIRVDTAATKRGLRDLKQRIDQSSAAGVREGARRFGGEASRRAPRLSGALADAIGSLGEPRRQGDAWVVHVGVRPGFRNPRGADPRLYAGKAEARTRFMSDAEKASVSEVRQIQTTAWSRAIGG